MVNRRERVRAATVQEIKDVARRQLVTEGAAAVSLRAIAREMGMTAPALYRYFPSFDHLVRSLVGDLFDEVCEAMEDARDLLPADDVDGRLIAVCRTFRAWSVGHRAEFGLLFNTPLPGHTSAPASPAQVGGARFGRIFFDLFTQVWHLHNPAGDSSDSLLSCWTRLYGLVSLEVFNHLRFALDDAEPFFESELRDIALRLGMPTLGIEERLQTIS